MAQEEHGSVTVNNSLQLKTDISALYLSKKFSDVILIVEGQKFQAHKVILAARSKYFEGLLYGDMEQVFKNEITIRGPTADGFQILLKYIYTGNIILERSKTSVYLDVLGLAHQCSFEELKISLSENLEDLVDSKNIYKAFNVANLYDISELKETCYKRLEAAGQEELIANDNFNNLNQMSMVKLLKREAFVLPDVEIFNIVKKWRETNEDVDNLVLNCVRLSKMSVADITTQVWPSKLFECNKLLGTISVIVNVGPETTKCSAESIKDVNLATTGLLLSAANTSTFLTGNRNIAKYAHSKIGDTNGISIDLGKNYFINHIFMSLYDGDLRFYMYYIEVSCNKKQWKKVIDHSNYPCRSYQYLYFEPEITRYIRVVGTHSSQELDKTNFHLIFLEAYYKSSSPKLVNSIIYPTTNVANINKKAVVIAGGNPSYLVDGDTENYRKGSAYTYHVIGSGSIIVQLAQPYLVSSIKLLLWDLDDRYYKYYIETSVNNTDWKMAVDRRNDLCRSWQHLAFLERVTVYIRITGTQNTSTDIHHFHCVHIECPALAF